MKTACEREDLKPTSVYSFFRKLGRNIRLVHIGRSYCSCLVPFVHKSHHFIIAVDHQLRQIFYVRAQARMFTDPEITSVLGVQQIPHFLIINLMSGSEFEHAKEP